MWLRRAPFGFSIPASTLWLLQLDFNVAGNIYRARGKGLDDSSIGVTKEAYPT